MESYKEQNKVQNTTKQMQQRVIEKMAEKLSEFGVKKLQITTIGNSISNGYSTTRETKPFLERIENFEKILTAHDIELEKNNFSRMRNNDDSKILGWLNKNITQKEINEINRHDYMDPEKKCNTINLTNKQIFEYYPLESEKTIKEAIFNNEENIANLVIYNGGTGHFLNQISRGGTTKQILNIRDLKDSHNLFNILQIINSNNIKNNSTTQVMACGMPNLLGMNLTEIFNKKIKKTAQYFPNTTYVNPVFCDYWFYDFKKKKYVLDSHYNPEQYTQMANNVLTEYTNNFVNRKSLIKLDKFLKEISDILEFNGNKYTNEQVINMIEDFLKKLSWEDTENFEKDIIRYLEKSFPDDYYSIGKNNFNTALKKIQLQRK